MKYRIIDGIAPFFINTTPNTTVNWSKVPFNSLETNGYLDLELSARVIDKFRLFVRQAAEIGYNAVTLDDLPHLIPADFYPAKLNEKIRAYQSFYRRLISIAESFGMVVFITADIMYFNEWIEEYTRNRDFRIIRLLGTAIRNLFKNFPSVEGIIFRIGESDGLDVQTDFGSRLTIKTPRQARRFVRSLLAIFERYEKLMIIRTWSIGAYAIGDLMWNASTYRQVFGGIQSDSLVISHKFGTTDFFRYLEINPLFFEGTQQKIIELQTRREYEGFGEFPSFVGYDYAHYNHELSLTDTLAGIYVWCNTGGWSHFNRLTFLDKTSLWNEVNTFVTLKIFSEGMSVEDAVREFYRKWFHGQKEDVLVKLLKLSDKVIKTGWYVPGLGQRILYFRRLRVPPLLWIFWDTIIVNHTLRRILKRLVADRREAIKDGYHSLLLVQEMKECARQLQLDLEPFEFQFETFKLLAVIREYFFSKWDPGLIDSVENAIERYKRLYPDGFSVESDFSPFPLRRSIMEMIFKIFLRTRPQYSRFEKFFLIRLIRWVYPVIDTWQRRRLPDISRKQAMGIQTLFK
ncbi:MAG: glycosyl hydrolase family 67 [Fibrobacterota bacterium]